MRDLTDQAGDFEAAEDQREEEQRQQGEFDRCDPVLRLARARRQAVR